MKRTIAAIAITLGLVACGGGDDDAGTSAERDPAGDDEQASQDGSTAAEPGDDTVDDDTVDDEPAEDEPAEDEPTEDESTDAEPADDEPTDQEPGDEPAGDSIDSIDDIPEPCRDLMADFLRDIEPVVETIDWEDATLADFEQIAGEFEERSDEFDALSDSQGCNDLEFADDDDGFGLIVDFADDVAPGTVPFFEFLDGMRSSVVVSGDDEGGDDAADDPSAAGQLEDCDDAISGIEQLMTEYDAFTEVPIGELTKYASMGTAMMSCTPEQLEFFENSEVADFLSR